MSHKNGETAVYGYDPALFWVLSVSFWCLRKLIFSFAFNVSVLNRLKTERYLQHVVFRVRRISPFHKPLNSIIYEEIKMKDFNNKTKNGYFFMDLIRRQAIFTSVFIFQHRWIVEQYGKGTNGVGKVVKLHSQRKCNVNWCYLNLFNAFSILHVTRCLQWLISENYNRSLSSKIRLRLKTS